MTPEDRYKAAEARWWSETCEPPDHDEYGRPIFYGVRHPASGRACPVPVRPGSHNSAAAFKAGCEDEWIDRMKSRYGGEW